MAKTAVTTLKRVERAVSSDRLLKLEGLQSAAKHREVVQPEHPAAAGPLLPSAKGESKSDYFRRLGRWLRRDLFSPAHAFEREGLYVYKRPVQSESGEKAALLASGGSMFHHVVVYVKQGDEVTALEFCPANEMDITDNMLMATPAAPVVVRPAPPPLPEHLPMLHIGVDHHPLHAQHVQKALAFAEATSYHALQNNCICFADFIVRVLTGGRVRGAPLIFDHLVGEVPAVDSPLLGLLAVTAQLTWLDVADGSRLTNAFLQQHPAALPPPPGSSSGEGLGSILIEPAGPADDADVAEVDAEEHAAASGPEQLAAVPTVTSAGVTPVGSLAAAWPAAAGASSHRVTSGGMGASGVATAGGCVVTTGGGTAPPAGDVGRLRPSAHSTAGKVARQVAVDVAAADMAAAFGAPIEALAGGRA